MVSNVLLLMDTGKNERKRIYFPVHPHFRSLALLGKWKEDETWLMATYSLEMFFKYFVLFNN